MLEGRPWGKGSSCTFCGSVVVEESHLWPRIDLTGAPVCTEGKQRVHITCVAIAKGLTLLSALHMMPGASREPSVYGSPVDFSFIGAVVVSRKREIPEAAGTASGFLAGRLPR